MPIVECVPNFSEGRDQSVIDQITQAIAGVEGATLLDVDPGLATNRTVVTFVGEPDAVVAGAFAGIQAAAQLIDMGTHTGAHARMGATDVCPFIPVSDITMEACVELARRLGRRVGEELGIPVYLYEAAASTPERVNLATVRAGEYEALPEKLADPAWKPDFGPAGFNSRSGATVIGARKFLIAYNVNVNSRDRKLAHDIALDIREAGRAKRDADGAIMRHPDGKAINVPGRLPAVKGVGWYIDEYDQAPSVHEPGGSRRHASTCGVRRYRRRSPEARAAGYRLRTGGPDSPGGHGGRRPSLSARTGQIRRHPRTPNRGHRHPVSGLERHRRVRSRRKDHPVPVGQGPAGSGGFNRDRVRRRTVHRPPPPPAAAAWPRCAAHCPEPCPPWWPI